MAPFGKIYSYPTNPRATRVMIIAEMNGLEIEIPPFTIGETNKSAEFLAKFPLGKVPAFEGNDGFLLTESIAIASYVAQAGPKADQLLGRDAKSQALIKQWASFAESELFNNAFMPIAMAALKLYPMNEVAFDRHVESLQKDVKALEKALEGGKKYLVGDEVTMADFMVLSWVYYVMKYFGDAEMRQANPNLVAYFESYAAVPEYNKYFGKAEYCEKVLTKDA
ncbi:glutathione S-transferase [Xylaria bambusicola]|uniref:glutathione S-transferase n=1 Tax=Xylaria bambusicola TaxID=326684 RepID=UPI002007357A|nr:glutathione S-transferase [Xylaria bambusicola]KAI0525954.1 glutathione S-transferase [Xylaria bambusicola]